MDRNLRGGVHVRGDRGGRGGQRRQRTVISDDIRATVIDHVLVHGMSMREAGQRVQPNISRFTVSTIIRRFREENSVSQLYQKQSACPELVAAPPLSEQDPEDEEDEERKGMVKRRVVEKLTEVERCGEESRGL